MIRRTIVSTAIGLAVLAGCLAVGAALVAFLAFGIRHWELQILGLIVLVLIFAYNVGRTVQGPGRRHDVAARLRVVGEGQPLTPDRAPPPEPEDRLEFLSIFGQTRIALGQGVNAVSIQVGSFDPRGTRSVAGAFSPDEADALADSLRRRAALARESRLGQRRGSG